MSAARRRHLQVELTRVGQAICLTLFPFAALIFASVSIAAPDTMDSQLNTMDHAVASCGRTRTGANVHATVQSENRIFSRNCELPRTGMNAEMAEREGFEPSMAFDPYSLSRRAPSTTRPPLRMLWRLRVARPGDFRKARGAWHAARLCAETRQAPGTSPGLRHRPRPFSRSFDAGIVPDGGPGGRAQVRALAGRDRHPRAGRRLGGPSRPTTCW